MAQIDDIDWGEYFESIQSVCPWSLDAWQKDRIDFVPFSWDGLKARDATWHRYTGPNFDAVVYVGVPDDIDELDYICAYMGHSPHCVYFWSHPEHTKGGHNQAPIPIIIQQDKENLDKVRKANKKHK